MPLGAARTSSRSHSSSPDSSGTGTVGAIECAGGVGGVVGIFCCCWGCCGGCCAATRDCRRCSFCGTLRADSWLLSVKQVPHGTLPVGASGGCKDNKLGAKNLLTKRSRLLIALCESPSRAHKHDSHITDHPVCPPALATLDCRVLCAAFNSRACLSPFPHRSPGGPISSARAKVLG
jgi:hypothetical protein